MIIANSDVPVAVPLIFLALGILMVIVNRKAFTDFDGELHQMAEKRANSNVVRVLGGSGDAAQEYEGLRTSRWLAPGILVAYFATVLVMLVKALAG